MPDQIPSRNERIMDVFYFIGYTSSAIVRMQQELAKLPIDPSRWSKTDREFMGALALQAAHAMGEMAEICSTPDITAGVSDEDIKALATIQRAGWNGG